MSYLNQSSRSSPPALNHFFSKQISQKLSEILAENLADKENKYQYNLEFSCKFLSLYLWFRKISLIIISNSAVNEVKNSVSVDLPSDLMVYNVIVFSPRNLEEMVTYFQGVRKELMGEKDYKQLVQIRLNRVPPYLQGICSKTPDWMPENLDGTKPYTHYVFLLYINIYDKV